VTGEGFTKKARHPISKKGIKRIPCRKRRTRENAGIATKMERRLTSTYGGNNTSEEALWSETTQSRQREKKSRQGGKREVGRRGGRTTAKADGAQVLVRTINKEDARIARFTYGET